ncbi:MAG: hypothetical protein HY925_11370 [Elusimicrobia bacterium]|nr:hypothetical protein [Elusimicrobiota bacterium]
MAVYLRCIAQTPDYPAAKRILSALRERVRHLAPRPSISADAPKPYWKMAGHYELSLRLAPANRNVYQSLKVLSTRWDWLSDGDTGVWAAERGGLFCIPKIVWAELQLD